MPSTTRLFTDLRRTQKSEAPMTESNTIALRRHLLNPTASQRSRAVPGAARLPPYQACCRARIPCLRMLTWGSTLGPSPSRTTSRQAVTQQSLIWRCPPCRSPLSRHDLRCRPRNNRVLEWTRMWRSYRLHRRVLRVLPSGLLLRRLRARRRQPLQIVTCPVL